MQRRPQGLSCVQYPARRQAQRFVPSGRRLVLAARSCADRFASPRAGSRSYGGSQSDSAEPTVTPTSLAQPARLQLPLLDPQVARELRLVAAHLLDEALGVRSPDEPSPRRRRADARGSFCRRRMTKTRTRAIVSCARASATRVQRRSGFRLPIVVSGGARSAAKPLEMPPKVASSRS